MKLESLRRDFCSDNVKVSVSIEGRNGGEITEFLYDIDSIETLESELLSIQMQIRDFRMKNFPESENISD